MSTSTSTKMPEDPQHNSVVNVNELNKSLQRFNWPDYAVFVVMLLICLLIGIYYGFIEKRTKRGQKARRGSAAQDYLVGGRNMAIFPIAVSLVSSWISGISLLGSSTEVYFYGVQYMYFQVVSVFAGFIIAYIFLPVFHDLQLTSVYEYLELRYDKRMRLLGSVIFVLSAMIWMPIVIYVPALAFNQVTGINIHIITPAVCVICIFYTLLGGIKAVVWTDVIQGFIMYGSIIMTIILGTINVGGFGVIWERNFNSDRIELPEFTMDPRVRHSIFSIGVGGVAHWIASSTLSQHMMQRYMALPTLKAAQRAMWTFVVLVTILLTICAFNGLLIFATYYDCDPLTTKLIKAKDQLLPLLVMDILGGMPGLPGLFVAGIFSAALSSLSTALNSIAAVFLEDFYKPYAGRPLSETETGYFMRGVVLVIGIISVALVFVVEHLGSVLQLSMSMSGISNGPILGIFTMGVLLPWINSKGAFIGGVTGMLCMVWICVRAQSDIASGLLTFPTKPLVTDGCDYDFFPNMTMTVAEAVVENSSSFQIHHMSYLFYCILGATITIIVGSIASFAFSAQNPHDIDPLLLAPCIRKYIKPQKLLSVRPDIQEQNCIIHAFDIKDNQIR